MRKYIKCPECTKGVYETVDIDTGDHIDAPCYSCGGTALVDVYMFTENYTTINWGDQHETVE